MFPLKEPPKFCTHDITKCTFMGIVERLAFTEWKIAPDLLLAVRPSLMICTDGVVRCINVPTMEVAD